MSTGTGGTNANNSLTSLKFLPGYNSGMAAADIATIAAMIKNDQNSTLPVIPGSFSDNGLLYVPNRGVLKMLPGDYVMVDGPSGWPILVSAKALSVGGSVWTS